MPMSTATKSMDIISKKKQIICTCSTLFCTFHCRCFLQMQCRFAGLNRQTSSLHIIFYGGIVLCAHQKFWCLSSCSLLFFSLPLIFILLAANIPHFLTAAHFHLAGRKHFSFVWPPLFSCFSSNEIRLLCFQLLALAPSMLSKWE